MATALSADRAERGARAPPWRAGPADQSPPPAADARRTLWRHRLPRPESGRPTKIWKSSRKDARSSGLTAAFDYRATRVFRSSRTRIPRPRNQTFKRLTSDAIFQAVAVHRLKVRCEVSARHGHGLPTSAKCTSLQAFWSKYGNCFEPLQFFMILF